MPIAAISFHQQLDAGIGSRGVAHRIYHLSWGLWVLYQDQTGDLINAVRKAAAWAFGVHAAIRAVHPCGAGNDVVFAFRGRKANQSNLRFRDRQEKSWLGDRERAQVMADEKTGLQRAAASGEIRHLIRPCFRRPSTKF